MVGAGAVLVERGGGAGAAFVGDDADAGPGVAVGGPTTGVCGVLVAFVCTGACTARDPDRTADRWSEDAAAPAIVVTPVDAVVPAAWAAAMPAVTLLRTLGEPRPDGTGTADDDDD